MKPSELHSILARATVPEHSVAFMQAVSGGEPFLVGPYLFLSAQDWLLAIGYPLSGDDHPPQFERALGDAVRKTRARDCWAICPELPPRLKGHAGTTDRYRTSSSAGPAVVRVELLVDAPVPAEPFRVDTAGG